MFSKCLLSEWMNSIWPFKRKNPKTQCPDLNPEALKIWLPGCPYLQPDNPIIIEKIDFLKAASQLSKRNYLAMVAAYVLSSLLERSHLLAKLRRVPWTQVPGFPLHSWNTPQGVSKRIQKMNPREQAYTSNSYYYGFLQLRDLRACFYGFTLLLYIASSDLALPSSPGDSLFFWGPSTLFLVIDQNSHIKFLPLVPNQWLEAGKS